MATASASTTSPPRRAEHLSVVIPAYNEAGRLGDTLQRVHAYLSKRFERFEIRVVDDGSTDPTSEVVRRFAETAPEVRLQRLEANAGKGCAVRSGILAAKGGSILFSDADLSTPIEEVEKALDLMAQGWDVAIGSRALPDSDVQVHQAFLRETMGKTFNVAVRLLSRLPFRDTQCGFKCYSREAARAIFSRAVIDGFGFDVESLLLARRLGFRVTDFPVRWVNSPDSRVRMFRHPAVMLWEVLRARVRVARGKTKDR